MLPGKIINLRRTRIKIEVLKSEHVVKMANDTAK
jgi:hypothetical protein